MFDIGTKRIGFIFGLILTFVGVLVMLFVAFSGWTLRLETLSSKVTLILVGAFIAASGIVIALAFSDKFADIFRN
jgi:hypothetical protein